MEYDKMEIESNELLEQEEKYRNYIEHHKQLVGQVFETVRYNLDRIGITKACLQKAESCVAAHDESKYKEDEFDGYRQHWQPTKDEQPNEDQYRYSWLKHIHRNPHHWQHWVIKDDDDITPRALKMPTHYLIELMCDWSAMAIFKGSDMIFWYNQHKHNFIMHEETRQAVERMLVVFSIAVHEIRKEL